MKIVNVTDRNIYNSKTGTVAPGRTTSDKYRNLEKAMQEVVDMCGKKFGIILNERESKLMESIVSLDELGEKFDVNSIPAEVRNDPLGKKRASEMARRAQQAAIDVDKKINAEHERREAIINGEIDEKARKPVGLATMEGVEVDTHMLKSGFEAILEENKKIASGNNNKRASVDEMLDPIGAHMKKDGAAESVQSENNGTGLGDAVPDRQPRNLGDALKNADAMFPAPKEAERANTMDQQALEMAQKLSIMGQEVNNPDPVSEPAQDKAPESDAKHLKDADCHEEPEQPENNSRGRKPGVKKGRGRGRKAV